MKEISVEIATADMETCFTKALKRLAQDLAIEGFRKGKVPPQLAEKYIRTDALFDEAAHIAIQSTYPDVVRHHEIEPVGKPDIEITKIARGNALAYKARVAVLSEVQLSDWRKIRVARKAITVGSDELEKALDYLQRSRTQYVAATHPAEKGNFAEIDFTIRQAGVIIENGSAEKHPFVIGEGKFIPGFEDNIIGMHVGEEKQFSLAFPADYHEKAYAGKTVDATVKLINLFDRKLPSRDDAFAESLGKFKTFAELEENVKNGILKEKEEHETSRVQMEVISTIADGSKMEVPEVLVERETDKMVEDLESRITSMGLTFDGYLLHLKKTKDELRHDWRKEGEKRVRIGLSLRAIARTEQIKPTESEVSDRMQDMAKHAEAERNYAQEALRDHAEGALINEKVLQLLEKECVVNS